MESQKKLFLYLGADSGLTYNNNNLVYKGIEIKPDRLRYINELDQLLDDFKFELRNEKHKVDYVYLIDEIWRIIDKLKTYFNDEVLFYKSQETGLDELIQYEYEVAKKYKANHLDILEIILEKEILIAQKAKQFIVRLYNETVDEKMQSIEMTAPADTSPVDKDENPVDTGLTEAVKENTGLVDAGQADTSPVPSETMPVKDVSSTSADDQLTKLKEKVLFAGNQDTLVMFIELLNKSKYFIFNRNSKYNTDQKHMEHFIRLSFEYRKEGEALPINSVDVTLSKLRDLYTKKPKRAINDVEFLMEKVVIPIEKIKSDIEQEAEKIRLKRKD